jgi:uncharacterized membrane protein
MAFGSCSILVGFFVIVLILQSVRYAYESLGVSSNTAILLLFATLIGSIFNIPITELPPERVMSYHVVDFFGMRYAVPVVGHVSLTPDMVGRIATALGSCHRIVDQHHNDRACCGHGSSRLV